MMSQMYQIHVFDVFCCSISMLCDLVALVIDCCVGGSVTKPRQRACRVLMNLRHQYSPLIAVESPDCLL